MIKWLFKYGAVILLLNTIFLSIESTYNLGNQIFYVLMVIFSLMLLINPLQIKKVIFHKSFMFLLLINVLNLLYFILFHNINDIEAAKYLLARGIQYSLIAFSIYYNFEYFKSSFLKHIVYAIMLVIFIGFIFNPNIFSGRYSGIIWNPNMLSSFVVIAFAIYFLKYEKRGKFDYGVLVTLLIIALATGSRGSLVGLFLVFLIKYGFSFRNLSYGVIAIVITLIITSVNLETSLNRFSEQSILNDRLLQFEYAIKSIESKMYVGAGLDKYSYIDKSLVPKHLRSQIIGAHNGYLSILTQYGVLFGGIILLIILSKSYQLYFTFKRFKTYERIYLFIILYTLLAAIYESLMTGINEFNTILFWLALAMLSYSKFVKEHES